MVIREPLFDDGAPYWCGFETYFEEVWHCPQRATEALTVEAYEKLKQQLPKSLLIQVAGRALCDTHLEVVERDYHLGELNARRR